jgi:hypothetical protein
VGPDVLADLPAGEAGHHHVEDDRGGLELKDALKGLLAVTGLDDRVAAFLKRASYKAAHLGVIISNEQRLRLGFGHTKLLARRAERVKSGTAEPDLRKLA